MTPREEGNAAHKSGVSAEESPYQDFRGSWQHSDWVKGWCESWWEAHPLPKKKLECGCDTHQFGCLSRPYDPSEGR